jgi:hypothetical protein
MLRSLFELLFWTSAEGLGLVAVRAWLGSSAHSQVQTHDWKNRSDDSVYKKNLQRLIEYHRKFEDAEE